ncbi:hypothetical protein K503DRAFT_833021, partial [Rhizopogon vinicolor AM-OR11-026]
RPVEFSRVLHVPDLCNILTCHKDFTVTINASKMSFERPTGSPLFITSIGDSNAAFLDGETVPIAEYASAATTLPLDLDLWHRRFRLSYGEMYPHGVPPRL